jgi:8-oxo-dGTP pyrophosphatase MutT (NUDIX family)
VSEGNELFIFGTPEPDIQHTERRAAYAVIISNDSRVAMVKGVHRGGDRFLPGGGSLPEEAPEDTVTREVREELARDVRLLSKIGAVIQYF